MSIQITLALVVLAIQIYRLVKAVSKRHNMNTAPCSVWVPEGRELR